MDGEYSVRGVESQVWVQGAAGTEVRLRVELTRWGKGSVSWWMFSVITEEGWR